MALPTDVLLYISGFCCDRTLGTMPRVCKDWRDQIQEEVNKRKKMSRIPEIIEKFPFISAFGGIEAFERLLKNPPYALRIELIKHIPVVARRFFPDFPVVARSLEKAEEISIRMVLEDRTVDESVLEVRERWSFSCRGMTLCDRSLVKKRSCWAEARKEPHETRQMPFVLAGREHSGDLGDYLGRLVREKSCGVLDWSKMKEGDRTIVVTTLCYREKVSAVRLKA